MQEEAGFIFEEAQKLSLPVRHHFPQASAEHAIVRVRVPQLAQPLWQDSLIVIVPAVPQIVAVQFERLVSDQTCAPGVQPPQVNVEKAGAAVGSHAFACGHASGVPLGGHFSQDLLVGHEQVPRSEGAAMIQEPAFLH